MGIRKAEVPEIPEIPTPTPLPRGEETLASFINEKFKELASEEFRNAIANLITSGRWEEVFKLIEAWGALSDWTVATQVIVKNTHESALLAAEDRLRRAMPRPLGADVARTPLGLPAAAQGAATLTRPVAVESFAVGIPPVSGVVNIGFSAVDQNVIAWAQARSSNLIVQISEELRANVRQYIVRAVQGNATAAEAAREIARIIPLHDRYARAVINRERTLFDTYYKGGMTQEKARVKAASMADKYADKLTRARARTIARTEIQFSTNHGQYIGYQTASYNNVAMVTKVWETAEDEDVCPVCGPLDKTEVGFSELFPGGLNHPPAHPNCFPGFVPVSSPTGIAAADSRWFEGEVVLIETADHGVLTVTPNHPVLTERGWVAAGEIIEGDNLAAYDGGVQPSVSHPDYERSETAIAEVFEAVRKARGVSPASVPVSAEDFHGDGIADSDVKIVLADRLLRNNGQSETFKVSSEGDFLIGSAGKVPLLTESAFSQIFLSSDEASNRTVSGGGAPLTLGGEHLGHTHPVGLTSTPDGYIVDSKLAIYDGSTDSEGGGKLLNALSPVVSFDKVLNVGREEFMGHVFNLQSGAGWYVANGIVVHNCRCSFSIVDNLDQFVPEYNS